MALRRRTGRKRGRPYNPNAKRHQTTRAGRAGLHDLGSVRLRQRKLRATGRADVECTAAGALYGLGHLDNAQYSRLGVLTLMLRRVAKAMGRGVNVEGLWRGLLAAGSRPTSLVIPLLGDQSARRQLITACRQLNGVRSLVVTLAEEISIPPLVIRAVQRRLTLDDVDQLEQLRRALDDLSLPRRVVEDEVTDSRL
jgi:hypothetical protein